MSIGERVLKVIAEEGHRTIREEELDTSFEQLGVDSLDKVCILYGLEQEFHLSIPDEEASKFTNVRQIIERLSAECGAPAAATPAE